MIKNVMPDIRHMAREAYSGYNDGWVQNGYREKLIEIRDFLNSLSDLKLHGEQTTEDWDGRETTAE